MKMKLWLILLSLCVFMLFACGSDHGTTSDTTDGSGSFRSVTETGFPKAPPNMIVVCGEESVTAWRGTYSWHVLLDNGMGSGKHADSFHPLTAGDAVPVITAGDGAEVTLVFEIPAEVPLPLTSLEVRRYPADAEAHEDYETVTAEGGVLTLTEDNALYEVIAAWDVSDGAYSGTAHYAFRTAEE